MDSQENVWTIAFKNKNILLQYIKNPPLKKKK